MSIKKNIFYNITYQILTMIIPLITTPYIARVIGAKGVGIQSYSMAIVNYFILFSMLGLNNYGNRSIAIVRNDKKKLNRVFWEIYSMQFLVSLLMILLYFSYVCYFITDNKIIFILQGINLFATMLDINWLFFGLEKFKITVTRNLIIKMTSVICIFVFVKGAEDLWIYVLISAVSVLLSQIILWIILFRYINLVKIRIKDILVHVKPNLILFIPIAAVSIYKVMDKIMLGKMAGMNQVGYYENTEKIINIPNGIIIALGTVMLPRISNLMGRGHYEKSEKYMRLSMLFAMFISIGSMFGLIGVTDVFIPIFLGKDFTECIRLTNIISITIIFIAWSNVLRTQYLIPKKKDNIYIVSTILGGIINLVINLLLINKYGVIGAAVGTIIAEFTVAFYQTIKIKNDINIYVYLKEISVFLIPGIIMLILIKIIGYYTNLNIITALIQVVIGGIVYVLLSGIGVYFLLKKQHSN